MLYFWRKKNILAEIKGFSSESYWCECKGRIQREHFSRVAFSNLHLSVF